MRTTLKSYTAIPIEVCKHFKGKDLYLLAGLYINAPYERGAEYMITDTTFEQLAETTGVKVEYIKDSFIPKLKEDGYIKCETRQIGYKKRNTYYLTNPKTNYRIIKAGMFSDSTLTDEEKGVIIGLYCLCVNSTFACGLSDRSIYNYWKMSKNTFKKYRNQLLEKKVLCIAKEAHLALTHVDKPEDYILMYQYIGHISYQDIIASYKSMKNYGVYGFI